MSRNVDSRSVPSSHPTRALALCALAAVAAAVYWPGLSGGFLFDDYANLPALGRYGPVRDWDSLLRYLTSGIADPTGRPVSMLSFLLDARDWPADPLPFKRTNLLLHVGNGLLLYAVLVALGRRVASSVGHARSAALLATALWLLHPLWVSTVLYVVQRHAMLATFFVLAGIRVWIASRDAFARGALARGWWLAVLAVPVCGLLAGLSKANGFLLPVLLLVLQGSVLRWRRAATAGYTVAADRHARWSSRLFVLLPALLVLVGLVGLAVEAVNTMGALRPWSLGERLLSQPRALFDYLYRLWVPGLDATGVFADGFPVSTGLLRPWTTLAALLALVALATLGIQSRLRYPALSAAILFFLGGHAMESSIIPLELYFEHRNYLPATLLFWPLALLLTRTGTYLRLRVLAGIGFALVCALATFAQAQLWGDPPALAQAWARALPGSARAQTYAASVDLQHGEPQRAIARLTPLLARHPDEAQYALTLMEAHCRRGRVPDAVIDGALHAVRSRGVVLDLTHQWLARTLAPRSQAACAGLPEDTLRTLALAAIGRVDADDDIETRSRAQRVEALLALRTGDCTTALAAYDARLDLQRRPEFTSEQVGQLATHCGPRTALAHLDHYQRGHASGDRRMSTPVLRLRDRIMARQDYWPSEWRRLRRVLEADLKKQDMRLDKAEGG